MADFRLSENFISNYRGKQPDWGPLGYITYKRCVPIHTPVLTRDLEWVPAGSLAIDDEILAFDEYPYDNHRRSLQVATIIHNAIETAECVEIKLSNGDTIQCTPDHSWLVKKAGSKLEWVEAQHLLRERTEKCYFLKYFDTWEVDTSYEGGFLAAAFDGEGCLDRHRGLQFTQVNNGFLERVLQYLTQFGFQYKLSEKKKTSENSQQCYSVRITGHDQVARFLGMFRPPRLLAKYMSMHDEMQLKRQKFRHKENIWVESVTPVGKKRIAVLSTSTKTHFTAGYPSHNTYARPVLDENRTEEWWETCKRVVEGTYQIQKEHCERLKLPWNGNKAQRSAQEMYKLIWDFKFLPPGRGLWMMGTEFVKKRGGAALNNPLGEDTLILTQEHGWISIGDIEGQRVTVLSNTKLYGRDNSTTAQAKWVEADISHAEMHPCYRITYQDKFGNNTSVVASQNHRWFRCRTSKKPWERVTTEELHIGDYLPITKPPKYYKISLEGAQHGFFFGDGTRSNGELHQFTADNRTVLYNLWPRHRIDEVEPINGHPGPKYNLGHHVVRQCPLAWGEIPQGSYAKDKRYIYGFLAGYVAADGHVDKQGNVHLSSARLDELEAVCRLFAELGIRTTEPRISSTKSNLVEDRNPLYSISINPLDLDEQFFLKAETLKRWKDNLGSGRRDWLKITSIDRLQGEHRVLCATVPEYEQFVIEGFCLSSNCAFVSTKEIHLDFAEPFTFLMDMSMLGVGVGGDCKGAGQVKIKEPRQGDYTFTVEDSREGWVELVRTYLNAYVGKGSLPKEVDYSKVRPYGTPIKSFGGTASGPGPLQDLVHKHIPAILDPLTIEESLITGSAIVDLFNAIGRCVVSGNVRRSAEIMFGNPEDEEFLELKNPKASKEHKFRCSDDGWRWASNNSVFAKVGMDYTDVASRTAANGEPGYFWLDNARRYGRMADPRGNESPFGPEMPDPLAEGANPCSEQTLESYELCCLVETFPARHKSFEEYERTLKFAYLYAKTVTLLPTHNARTNAVMLRNRRIGTSQSGIVQSFFRHGVREHFAWCDQGYRYLRNLDRIYSRWLCIPESIKVTSVKPSGTVSLLCGATPGVHFPYSEYYWRTIRFDTGSELLEALRKSGYRIEEGEGHSTSIVYFPVKEEDFQVARRDVTMYQQLEIVAQMQHWWADNQVSVTVTFHDHEAGDISGALQLYETRLKSVSFLPLKIAESTKYKHPPYQPMTKEEYESATKKLKPIRLKKIMETEGFEHHFCDNDRCELPSRPTKV